MLVFPRLSCYVYVPSTVDTLVQFFGGHLALIETTTTKCKEDTKPLNDNNIDDHIRGSKLLRFLQEQQVPASM